MARSASNVLQSLIRKLPTGFALGARGGVIDALLAAAADVIAAVEADAERLMDETDPRKAVALLEDFERVLGPDPCGRDLDANTIDDRQRLAHQRWTAGGGQSIPQLMAIAAKLGVTVKITDYWPTKATRARAGQRLRPEGVQWVWLVEVPLGVTLSLLVGLQCEYRRVAAAQTIPVVRYGAA